MHASPPSEVSAVLGTDENHLSILPRLRRAPRALVRSWRYALPCAAVACMSSSAHASIFEGETLDKVANVLSWAVLVIVPVVGIAVFWLVHILPEKIAYKRHHPQAKAIHTLCLLSLVFGGMLWPLAWLWAYSKPVLYKMAYGTDVDETVGHAHEKTPEEELETLRLRMAELEAKARGSSGKKS